MSKESVFHLRYTSLWVLKVPTDLSTQSLKSQYQFEIKEKNTRNYVKCRPAGFPKPIFMKLCMYDVHPMGTILRFLITILVSFTLPGPRTEEAKRNELVSLVNFSAFSKLVLLNGFECVIFPLRYCSACCMCRYSTSQQVEYLPSLSVIEGTHRCSTSGGGRAQGQGDTALGKI